MRKDADFTGKIKSAVAGGGRNRYNKDSVFLSLDIEETTGGQYADNRNQRNMDSTLCKAWMARLSHVAYRMTPTTLERPYLNPDWVEWLMGFPRKWTDISFGPKNPPTSRV